MNEYRDTRFRFFPAGHPPFVETAVAALVLTRKMAYAIVAGKLIMNDTLGRKPKTCTPNFIQADNLPPVPPVGSILFP